MVILSTSNSDTLIATALAALNLAISAALVTAVASWRRLLDKSSWLVLVYLARDNTKRLVACTRRLLASAES